MTDDISDDEDEEKFAPQPPLLAEAPAFAYSSALGGFSPSQLSDLGLLSPPPPPPIGGVLGYGVDPAPSRSVGGILGLQDVSQSIGLPASPRPRRPFEAGFALLSSGYTPPPSAFDPSQTPGPSRIGLLSPPPPIGGVLGQGVDPDPSSSFGDILDSQGQSQFLGAPPGASSEPWAQVNPTSPPNMPSAMSADPSSPTESAAPASWDRAPPAPPTDQDPGAAASDGTVSTEAPPERPAAVDAALEQGSVEGAASNADARVVPAANLKTIFDRAMNINDGYKLYKSITGDQSDGQAAFNTRVAPDTGQVLADAYADGKTHLGTVITDDTGYTLLSPTGKYVRHMPPPEPTLWDTEDKVNWERDQQFLKRHEGVGEFMAGMMNPAMAAESKAGETIAGGIDKALQAMGVLGDHKDMLGDGHYNSDQWTWIREAALEARLRQLRARKQGT